MTGYAGRKNFLSWPHQMVLFLDWTYMWTHDIEGSESVKFQDKIYFY